MQVGTVQKLISIFDHCFRELGVSVSLEKLEDLSVTIHRAMTVQARQFHTLEHVFSFFNPSNAIISLSALYHDIVYHQVDMGFSPHIWEIISPYIRQENESFFITDHLPEGDTLFALTLDIFDLQPSQQISSVSALNEFLSALVMNNQIGDLVKRSDLALMIMCIEATIPFRGLTADGKSHFEVLEERMPAIIERNGLDIDQDCMIDAIKTALIFANKDIENFAELDPCHFLDNTWKLLPETNAALRLPDVYSISAYRQALQKMAGFFDNLKPENVFNCYRDLPPKEVFDQLVQRAGRNIMITREYLGIKILGTTILEALAQATGGDAPLSLFLGDIPREGLSIKRLEYYLPELEDPTWVDRTSTIYQLLESGRSSETSFDIKNSPLSLFLFKTIPPEKLAHFRDLADDFHSGRLSASEFLNALDPALVGPIARASSIMVFTRRQALLKFAGEDHAQHLTGLL